MEKINGLTQKGIVLRHLAENPFKWFTCADFVAGRDGTPFVGYEAGSNALSPLVTKGYLLTRQSRIGRIMKEYRMNHSEYSVEVSGDDLFIKRKPDLPL